MPRGRSGGRSTPKSFSRNVPATRPSSNIATTQPVPRQGPGLFGQMASTAAGVAVGSTVGHVVGGALTSGYHNNPDSAAPSSGNGGTESQSRQNPCQFEFEQFVQCAQNEHDISFCKGFNEVLKQCKQENGLI